MDDVKYNLKFIKIIYRNVSPILIWSQIMKDKLNKRHKFKGEHLYQLIKEMRNSASHLDMDNTDEVQTLFINIVLLYRKFGIDIVDLSTKVKDIWKDLYQSSRDKCCKFKFRNSYLNPKDLYVNNHHNYLLFGKILSTFYNHQINNCPNIIDLVFRFCGPLILWNQIMLNSKKRNKGTEFEQNINESSLFKIAHKTKNNICHLSQTTENVSNEKFCKEILENILIIYQTFGLDLRNHVKKIKEIHFDSISLSLGYNKNDLDSEIRTILSNRNNIMYEYYFKFGTLLHYLVTNDLPNNHFITKVFCEKNNILEWNESKKMFIKNGDRIIMPDSYRSDQYCSVKGGICKCTKCKICIIIFILLAIIIIWYLMK